MKKNGLIIAYTGEGKGKSTAALGLAIRAIGQGRKVCIIQFIKSYKQTGEAKFFRSLKENCTFFTLGEGFVFPKDSLKKLSAHQNAANKALNEASKIISLNDYSVIILDEIIVAKQLNLITAKQIKEILKLKKSDQTIVMTGRGSLGELKSLCDLITNMQCVSHPFDKGVKAIKGIDY